MQLFRRCEATWDQVDDWIDKWHDGDSKLGLHEFLGMTQDEYALFVKTTEPYFTCYTCGKLVEYEYKNGEMQETLAEFHKLHPSEDIDDCGITCDPCFEEFSKWRLGLDPDDPMGYPNSSEQKH